ncbi:bacterio-opsin activator [Haloarcula sp. JP-Z28]|uniref:Helix-turn-helix domain-containing protein n=1 Tax=Haloarcula marismortui ATCC 33800 TaxID=662476 RepID=M0K458_9EURY|nr:MULTISPECIES: helix-turn-helix domain-containing protein [Haloarcula]EMA15568.1 transcription regulator [Haloarcula sinaiiensis ATCC 33800]NHN61935.1 bacterio-opsin activator [Haloarcula sp. JP-Z28]QUJ72319.1 helix-turn-helix domain-containing protein [Haloarcula sinaiiensis ATCC 33800]
MKYVTLSLWMAPEVRHSMHQFVVEHDGYEASYLLRGNDIGSDLQTLLFHVDGFPPEPYRVALEQAETVREYAISTCPDETFFLYVQDSPSATGHDLVDALTRAGLVIVSPVAYRTDGTVGLTLVGPGGTVQQAVETVPDGVSVDVREVGEYDSRRLDTGAALTDRQFEAVAAAVDCGYYGDTREGGVDDVADELGCAPGTAAEHLRKAEARVMADILEQRPASTA